MHLFTFTKCNQLVEFWLISIRLKLNNISLYIPTYFQKDHKRKAEGCFLLYLVLTSLEIAWAGTCRLIVLKEISSSSENEDVSSDSSSSSEAEDNGL